ncbi:MAG: ABC transporter permease [Bryobacterales bacterium]|nr:ABC transporter permease [Bryobacterales bacterium]
MLAALQQDLRHGLRMLLRTPRFTIPAVVALALGVGATTVIVSYAQATSLRLFAYRDALGILGVNRVAPDGRERAVPVSTYQAWREHADSLAEIAGSSFTTANLTGVDDPEPLFGSRITASLMPLLGVTPEIGRGFHADDEQPGAPPVVMLSERLWRRRYGADPALVGRTVRLNDDVFTVIGVMPGRYYGYGPILAFHDYWVPLVFSADAPGLYLDRDARNDSVTTYARLRPSVEASAALGELDRIATAAEAAMGEDRSAWKTRVTPLHERVVHQYGQTLATFWAAACGLLLIACINVALMMLARANERSREFALRSTLGAGAGRLARQLLAESLLLAGAGGLCGVLLAFFALPAVQAWAPANLRRGGLDSMAIDGPTLIAALALSIATAVAFGSLPALRAARPNLLDALKLTSGSGSSGRGGRLFQDALVVCAIASSLALLIVSSLLVESFRKLSAVDPGYQTRQVLTAPVPVPLYKYDEAARGRFYRDVADRVAAIPGALSVAVAVPLPLGNIDTSTRFLLEGDAPSDKGRLARFGAITDAFFQTLDIPLLAGRAFDPRDNADAEPVVIVNQAAARAYWPGENPLGKRIRFDLSGDGPWASVVGVAGDIHYSGLDGELEPILYRPVTQSLFGTFGMTLLVRANGDPLALAPALRKALAQVDPDAPLSELRTMQAVVAEKLAAPKHQAAIVSLFAGLALVLALVGVYGVVSYAVSRRTSEIGLRKALGTSAADTALLVARRMCALLLAGLGAGLLLSHWLTPVLAGKLFGVRAGDPGALALAAGALSLGALMAAALPSIRAARIPPSQALRHE